MQDADYAKVADQDRAEETYCPILDVEPTQAHNGLGHTSEGSSDNQDHIHYYRNHDTVLSRKSGSRAFESLFRLHGLPLETRLHRK